MEKIKTNGSDKFLLTCLKITWDRLYFTGDSRYSDMIVELSEELKRRGY